MSNEPVVTDNSHYVGGLQIKNIINEFLKKFAARNNSGVGSTNTPVYVASNGTITPCGNSLNVSITGSASSATSATTAASATNATTAYKIRTSSNKPSSPTAGDIWIE